jgi:hypothetical protein
VNGAAGSSGARGWGSTSITVQLESALAIAKIDRPRWQGIIDSFLTLYVTPVAFAMRSDALPEVAVPTRFSAQPRREETRDDAQSFAWSCKNRRRVVGSGAV